MNDTAGRAVPTGRRRSQPPRNARLSPIPKGLHHSAQGWRVREPTLGLVPPPALPTLKGLDSGPLVLQHAILPRNRLIGPPTSRSAFQFSTPPKPTGSRRSGSGIQSAKNPFRRILSGWGGSGLPPQGSSRTRNPGLTDSIPSGLAPHSVSRIKSNENPVLEKFAHWADV
jgi:hypothetical protein